MSSLRFPKSARLHRSSEFQAVKDGGENFPARFMVLNLLKDACQGESRIGLITSRKVGSAVVRNRVRRRLRELVRLTRPRLVPGAWVVLIARMKAAEADYDALRRDWAQVAGRAGILKP